MAQKSNKRGRTQDEERDNNDREEEEEDKEKDEEDEFDPKKIIALDPTADVEEVDDLHPHVPEVISLEEALAEEESLNDDDEEEDAHDDLEDDYDN